MYTPTKFSGNLPYALQMECNDPFSQYLERVSRAGGGGIREKGGRTDSRMMFRYSAVLLKPMYFTILGC